MNDNEYIEAMLAAYKLRAMPVNINYNYVESELEYVYNDADAVVLIVHRQFIARAAAVIERVPTLKTVLVVDDRSQDLPCAYRGVQDSEKISIV